MEHSDVGLEIRRLIEYGHLTGILEKGDEIYAQNRLLDLMGEDAFFETPDLQDSGMTPAVSVEDLPEILGRLLDLAWEKGIIPENTTTYRDLFDAKLMDALMPRPSTVIAHFWDAYHQGKTKATDWYYRFSQDSDYIRRYRIAKDVRWTVDSAYGEIELSINLAKPEKDPAAIAAAAKSASKAYPKCQLCMENEGYAGRIDHPGRSNHRIIPIRINDGDWGFQYSPYVYYNEHCIVLNRQHVPMKIERATFVKLFDFVKQFPHYFLGSNADLPIVGGSILSHDHYQGGRHTFPMAKAALEKTFTVPGYEDVEAGIVHWPLSVIRLRAKDTERIIDLADHILGKWRAYGDAAAEILAESNGQPHNTITPIARFENGAYELDLVLRNNRTSEERPMGIFHPREAYHHIKKENIGLIEVMGLAILPSRLKKEAEVMTDLLTAPGGLRMPEDPALKEMVEKHWDWLCTFAPQEGFKDRKEAETVLFREIGNVFVHVLEDAGVYPCTPEGREAFDRFLAIL